MARELVFRRFSECPRGAKVLSMETKGSNVALRWVAALLLSILAVCAWAATFCSTLITFMSVSYGTRCRSQ